MTTDRSTLEATLAAMDFPASKDDLVQYAANTGADEDTLRALRSIPPVDYGNLAEVVRSVPYSREAEGEQSDPEKARRARRGKERVVEHEVETPPNPIADELGENRGS
jgi:hypothetical protein